MAELGPGEVDLRVDSPWFEAFVHEHGLRLRRALVAASGVQIGNDACAEALAWAWEHRDRLVAMDHPVAYLYRVGQSAARRQRRWRRELDLPVEVRSVDDPEGSMRLDVALNRLSHKQRTVVILVHSHGWSYAEVADALGVSVATVRNHVHRGMQRLRGDMEAL